MANIGSLIRDYRKEKKLSQLELALKVGWENPSTLSRIEKGEVKPTRETILKLSNQLLLDSNKLNKLLMLSGYSNEIPDLTLDYLKNLRANVLREIDAFSHPVSVFGINGIQLCANKAMFKILLGKSNVNLKEDSINDIDLLFDEKYGIKQKIVNWEMFSKNLVETIFKLFYMSQENPLLKDSIERWKDKYEDFNNIWKNLNPETVDFKFYKNIMDFNHPEIGVLNFSISASPLYEDNRFFIQHFQPVSADTVNKLEIYLKEK